MQVSILKFLDKPEHYLGLLLEKQNEDDTIEIYLNDGKYSLYLIRKNPNQNTNDVSDQMTIQDIIKKIEDLDANITMLKNKIIFLEAKAGIAELIQDK